MIFSILILLNIVVWIFFIFAVDSEENDLLFISGCGLILLGVYMIVNGISNLNNWVTQAISVIQLGLGMICIVSPFKDIWGYD